MTTHHAPAGRFTPTFLLDAGERITATYVQAFLGLLLAGTFTLNISALHAAAVAAIPAALAAVKALVASTVGQPGSASLAPGLATVDAADPRDASGRALVAVPPGGVVNVTFPDGTLPPPPIAPGA